VSEASAPVAAHALSVATSCACDSVPRTSAGRCAGMTCDLGYEILTLRWQHLFHQIPPKSSSKYQLTYRLPFHPEPPQKSLFNLQNSQLTVTSTMQYHVSLCAPTSCSLPAMCCCRWLIHFMPRHLLYVRLIASRYQSCSGVPETMPAKTNNLTRHYYTTCVVTEALRIAFERSSGRCRHSRQREAP